jgi:hypothetical protein
MRSAPAGLAKDKEECNMERKKQSRGDCVYCSREMTKGGLARHLKTCAKRLEAQATADQTHRRKQTLYHLQVQDAWSGDYWLHLEMRGEATLEELDSYLRAIWLECCGHLSQFEIGGVYYTQIFEEGFDFREERAMDVPVGELFTSGLEIPYEYDFGTTTDLVIKVVDQREGRPTTSHPIVLMARNKYEPPSCMECERPATYLCNECLYEHEGERYGLCDEHEIEHEHGEEYIMPLVNSPRVGQCGYTGPAEPPY